MDSARRILQEKGTCPPGSSKLFFLVPVVRDCQNMAGLLLVLIVQWIVVVFQQTAFLQGKYYTSGQLPSRSCWHISENIFHESPQHPREHFIKSCQCPFEQFPNFQPWTIAPQKTSPSDIGLRTYAFQWSLHLRLGVEQSFRKFVLFLGSASVLVTDPYSFYNYFFL